MDGTISRRHKLGSRFAHVVHFTSAFYSRVLLLGDPQQECLEDSRSDRRTRVREAVLSRGAAMAAECGLHCVRALDREDPRRFHDEVTGRNFHRSRCTRLHRVDLMVEAPDDENIHCIVVVTPYRASLETVERVGSLAALMSELTGPVCHPVVASVGKDQQAEDTLAASSSWWHPVSMAALDQT